LGVAGDVDGDLVVDLGIFQRFFQSNARHLEYLELEPATFFTNDRLPILSLIANADTLKSPGAALDFDSLQHLSLTEFSLEPDYGLLTSTLRIEQLQSLRLCECEKQLDFLKALARSDRGVNLRSFETFHTQNVPHYNHTLVPIKIFLKSFTGLEDLCISVKEWYCTGESFLDSIL
jgi:hypothetical protein